MKIPDFKYFSGSKTVEAIAQYLSTEHTLNLRDLITALKKLDFSTNFDSFEVTVSIEPSEELFIENKLRSGVVPSKRIIVRSNSYEITDGDTAWDKNFVTLKNNGALAASVTVVFLK